MCVLANVSKCVYTAYVSTASTEITPDMPGAPNAPSGAVRPTLTQHEGQKDVFVSLNKETKRVWKISSLSNEVRNLSSPVLC